MNVLQNIHFGGEGGGGATPKKTAISCFAILKYVNFF